MYNTKEVVVRSIFDRLLWDLSLSDRYFSKTTLYSSNNIVGLDSFHSSNKPGLISNNGQLGDRKLVVRRLKNYEKNI